MTNDNIAGIRQILIDAPLGYNPKDPLPFEQAENPPIENLKTTKELLNKAAS